MKFLVIALLLICATFIGHSVFRDRQNATVANAAFSGRHNGQNSPSDPESIGPAYRYNLSYNLREISIAGAFYSDVKLCPANNDPVWQPLETYLQMSQPDRDKAPVCTK